MINELMIDDELMINGELINDELINDELMINGELINDELMINGELINDELMINGGELMINPLVVCRSDGICVLGAADLPADDDGDRQDACVPQTGHLGASTCINLHQFA
jgi:hypothetical protein